MELKTHGLTEQTPQNLMFAAGVYYKNLKWVTNAWSGTILGATSGGGKLNIEQTYQDAEIDGVNVKVKGLKNKNGGTATMDMNLTEISQGSFTDALHLVVADTQDVTGYVKLEMKSAVTDDDYLENIAFVGLLNNGKRVIVIMDNAFLNGVLQLEPKNKTQAVFLATAECHSALDQEDINKLPVHIYFPTETV